MGFVTEYLYRHMLPAAYGVLPPAMRSPKASAMLLAIALQESGCVHRRQVRGPARGFFQFEAGGVYGVKTHRASKPHLEAALSQLIYKSDLPTNQLLSLLEHNDVVACVCARLLLRTDAEPLPDPDHGNEGYKIYLRTWRPGKPHVETWPRHFAAAWAVVTDT